MRDKSERQDPLKAYFEEIDKITPNDILEFANNIFSNNCVESLECRTKDAKTIAAASCGPYSMKN